MDIYLSTVDAVQDQEFTEPQKICIITPYSAQIRAYIDAIRALTRLPEWQVLNLMNIKLSTVDAVQGQEIDIVIADIVKAGRGASTGFVRTLNRLNVLFSRAIMVRVFIIFSGHS